jgi:hypothetical protein
MEKICLVYSGNFLLGIAVADIVAQISLFQAKATAPIFHLGALLARQAAPLVQAEDTCLHLQLGEEAIYLHVDHVVETFEPVSLLPPPRACPQLFTQLCPRLTLWQDSLVFLVEARQILPVWQTLGGEERGRITVLPNPPPEPETLSEEAEEQKTLFLAPPAEAAPLLLSHERSEEQPEEDLSSVSEEAKNSLTAAQEAVEAVSCPQAEADAQDQETEEEAAAEQQQKDQATIDEATFKQVMDWTVLQFKQSKGRKIHNFGIEQLPPDISASIEEKGLNKNIIQYLIDQIVLRCQEKTSHQKHHAG